MKVLLACGFETRLSEETDIGPKPMIEIGGKPILWHTMDKQILDLYKNKQSKNEL